MDPIKKPPGERVALDFCAKTEVAYARRWMERLIWKLLSALGKPSPLVLEAACTDGWDTEVFLQRGARVVSICSSKERLEFARRRVPEGDFRVQDLAPFDLPSGEFDAVWCITLIDNLTPDSATKILAEFARVLKQGGLLAFNCTACDEMIRRSKEFSSQFDLLTREPYPEDLFEKGIHHITARKR